MRGNINLMAKRSMKIRGKGHLATKTNGLNRLSEVQKIHQEKQIVTSDMFASSKSSAFDFFGPGCLLEVTSLYDRFMATLISQCFGECEIRFFLCNTMRNLSLKTEYQDCSLAVLEALVYTHLQIFLKIFLLDVLAF